MEEANDNSRDGNVRQLHEDLISAIKDMKDPVRNASNPHFKSKFANLEETLGVVRAALLAHGMCLIQVTELVGDKPVLVTQVLHKNGLAMRLGSYLLNPEKANPQGLGSAITYARRYAIKAAFGLADSDDDGEGSIGDDVAKIESKTQAAQPFEKRFADNVALVQAAKNPTELQSVWKEHAPTDPKDVAAWNKLVKARKAELEGGAK